MFKIQINWSVSVKCIGTVAAESLNLFSIAQQTGFTRELVEAGIKDVVHGIFKVLKRGAVVDLCLGAVGKIYFQSADIKFRF